MRKRRGWCAGITLRNCRHAEKTFPFGRIHVADDVATPRWSKHVHFHARQRTSVHDPPITDRRQKPSPWITTESVMQGLHRLVIAQAERVFHDALAPLEFAV